MAEHYVPENLPTHIQHYIDGEFVDSIGGETFDVLDPVSNKTYVKPPPARRTTSTAPSPPPATRSTNGPWPRMLPRERSRVLHRIADIVESREPGSPNWRPSTPACRSPRPWARRSARRRTSASSPT